MLSILIPVYNTFVSELVRNVHAQAISAKIVFEIIVCDDNSLREYKETDPDFKDLEYVRYLSLPQNHGRAGIRNILAHKAQYSTLLFIDADAKITDTTYITNYCPYLSAQSIVYGGVAYEESKQGEKNLRYTYGISRESRSADERNTYPYQQFSFFNLLIPKDVYISILCNEDIGGYGHEDTVFGLEAEKLAIPLLHINNPLLHTGIDSNEEYIDKIRESIHSLHRIVSLQIIEKKHYDSISLLSAYKTLKTIKLVWLCNILFRIFRKNMERRLLQTANLTLLDMYKLGYFCYIKNNTVP